MKLRDKLNARKNDGLARTKDFPVLPFVYDDTPTKEDRETGRVYVTPEGKVYPSATTVLGAVGDKSWLDEWKDRIGQKEANKITYQSGRRGTELHLIIEKYLLGDDTFKNIISPLYRDFFLQVKPIIDKNVESIFGIEIPLYSNALKIAGTADLIANVAGFPSIVDWKNARRFKTLEDIEGYFFQTCMYAQMFEERTGIKIPQLCVIMAVEGNTGNEGLMFTQKTSDWINRTKAIIDEYYSNQNS